MRDATTNLLQQLQANAWFAHCGEPFRAKGVRRVNEYVKAISLLDKSELEVIGYQHANDLEQDIRARGSTARKRWKATLGELELVARDLIIQHVKPIREQRSWSFTIDMIVQYDVTQAFLELEFADLRPPPGYFQFKIQWYLAGHFPCGVTAKGQLLVY